MASQDASRPSAVGLRGISGSGLGFRVKGLGFRAKG